MMEKDFNIVRGDKRMGGEGRRKRDRERSRIGEGKNGHFLSDFFQAC